MSITDELREWASVEVPYKYGHQLNAIADRIDAEHEAMLADVRKTVYQGLIELPKDADGEYIHVGDVMEWSDGETFEVVGIGDGVLFYVENENDGPAEWTGASTKRHYHAPTVEDVLCDLLNEYRENECTLEEARLSEYAAKLRLAEEED